MIAIERDNPALKDVLPKDYARQGLDQTRLGEVVDLVSNIRVGDADARSRDVLGRVYEYFLEKFAIAEGRRGGEFYTPRGVVRLLVEMLQPYSGRVYDPCCGSSGMFVQSIDFIRSHQSGNGNSIGRRDDISIYGQESNYTTWRLAQMNLAIRGIDGQIEQGDTFRNDRHPDLKADFILANPPFNISEWGGEGLREDQRWRYGVPPAGNANFAWVQHMVHHLSPRGMAGFVLANGSMSSSQSNEGEIRKNLIEADLVDCMVTLPGQLFMTTQIPVCLWFLARNRRNGRFRDRRGRYFSSMLGTWAALSTALTANSRTKTSVRSPIHITPGAKAGTDTRTRSDSAKAPRWTRYARTTMFLRRADTWAPRCRRTTVSLLKRKWSD